MSDHAPRFAISNSGAWREETSCKSGGVNTALPAPKASAVDSEHDRLLAPPQPIFTNFELHERVPLAYRGESNGGRSELGRPNHLKREGDLP